MTEDFGLEREHREFRDTFRRFVADKVAPMAERGEREQRFPREVYAVLRDAGFLAVNFPVESTNEIQLSVIARSLGLL